MKSSRHSRSRSLQYESLERREMMAVTASLSKAGVLSVKGTKKADNVNFVQTAGVITIGGVKGSWAADRVYSVVIDLGKGNDSVSFNSLSNGGTQALAENITFKSSAGTDVVHLADGHDVSVSGVGHALFVNTTGTAWLDGVMLSWDTPHRRRRHPRPRRRPRHPARTGSIRMWSMPRSARWGTICTPTAASTATT